MEEFTLRQKTYRFDNSGDINMGYDIVIWRSEGRQIHVHDIIAEYHPVHQTITYRDLQNQGTTQLLQDLQVGPRFVHASPL